MYTRKKDFQPTIWSREDLYTLTLSLFSTSISIFMPTEVGYLINDSI